MKKILFLLSLLILLVFAITNCDNAGTNIGCDCDTDTTLTDTTQEDNSLVGTRWALVAFVDVENNESREPDYTDRYGNEVDIPKDSMYRLSFVDDTHVTVKLMGDIISGLYYANYDTNNLFMVQLSSSLMGHSNGDTSIFRLILAGSLGFLYFELYPQELHIFYKNGQHYLKFKRLE